MQWTFNCRGTSRISKRRPLLFHCCPLLDHVGSKLDLTRQAYPKQASLLPFVAHGHLHCTCFVDQESPNWCQARIFAVSVGVSIQLFDAVACFDTFCPRFLCIEHVGWTPCVRNQTCFCWEIGHIFDGGTTKGWQEYSAAEGHRESQNGGGGNPFTPSPIHWIIQNRTWQSILTRSNIF